MRLALLVLKELCVFQRKQRNGMTRSCQRNGVQIVQRSLIILPLVAYVKNT